MLFVYVVEVNDPGNECGSDSWFLDFYRWDSEGWTLLDSARCTLRAAHTSQVRFFILSAAQKAPKMADDDRPD